MKYTRVIVAARWTAGPTDPPACSLSSTLVFPDLAEGSPALPEDDPGAWPGADRVSQPAAEQLVQPHAGEQRQGKVGAHQVLIESATRGRLSSSQPCAVSVGQGRHGDGRQHAQHQADGEAVGLLAAEQGAASLDGDAKRKR
jgi:hypothetical protein